VRPGERLTGLRQSIRACLSGQSNGEQLTVAATNRRGRSIHCQVTVSALRDASHQLRDVIMIMAERES
jgi:two-component system CheB/CheR fusion protein